MTAAATQQMPAIPPRPSRAAAKDTQAATPMIPPRPSGKRIERSVSPNSERFAPSPLYEGILARHSKTGHLSPGQGLYGTSDDPIERSGSVPLPSVGEEGAEYNAVAQSLERRSQEQSRSRTSSPEQTRTVAEDLKLHAPKPSLPADSAKARVQAVTRTDSDKAAAYGIGRPSLQERGLSRESIKKRPSSSYSNGSDQGQVTEDEHGIPEIGQRVPMNPNLGDVQAPSPGPGAEGAQQRHHHRKHSSRSLPPGSYGLHGHGQAPHDKLEKAFYQKHPELLKEEQNVLHQRQNDFAMSSEDLNKLVRSRAEAADSTSEFRGTPSDEAAFQASQEYAQRFSSRPTSMIETDKAPKSPLATRPITADSGADADSIHVDDARRKECISYGDESSGGENDDNYTAPILAADQISDDRTRYAQSPAVHPHSAGAYESDAPSRPTSRPASIHHNNSQPEIRYTPLEDVEEYEPLFPEDAKAAARAKIVAEENRRRQFPSKDIWEDAPNSVHYTATVSTPDLVDSHHRTKSGSSRDTRPMTPAQAFAQQQEELAERESHGRQDRFLPLSEDKPNWAQSRPKVDKPSSSQRFPSRDIWEDVPESQLYETTVSSSPKDENKPGIPARPAKKSSEPTEKPAIPNRPKPRQSSGDDDAKPSPGVSDKVKPTIPSRPSKTLSGDSKDGEASKTKPPVPNRPMGGKIAALQAGFMNDLNKRLQLGPQGPKKEEASEQEEAPIEEKAPLSDARKGRARGPQRRAPAKSPAPATEAPKPAVPTLTFTMYQSSWSIDPDHGKVAVEAREEELDRPTVDAAVDQPAAPVETTAEEKPQVPQAAPEPIDEPEATEKLEDAEEPPREEKTLAANMAGESVLETTVEKTADGEVKPVDVADEVKP